MVNVEIPGHLKLSDLETGKIFEGNELIILNDGTRMATLTRELNYLDHGKVSEISVRHYDLVVDEKGDVQAVNYNGYNECPTDKKNHEIFDRKLQEAGL